MFARGLERITVLGDALPENSGRKGSLPLKENGPPAYRAALLVPVLHYGIQAIVGVWQSPPSSTLTLTKRSFR